MLHVLALTTFLFCYCIYLLMRKNRQTAPSRLFNVFTIIGLAFLVRVILATSTTGYRVDLTTFGVWADRMFSDGPALFYQGEGLSDYPPLYMYVLYLVGFLRSAFNLEFLSAGHLLIMKLPSILADLMTAYLLYREGKKKHSETNALLLLSVYGFLPPVLLNSSVWGQVDSLLTLLVVLMCLGLMNKKLSWAYLFYALGIFFKPQMLVFSPVLLLAMYENLVVDDFSLKKLGRSVLSAFASFGAILLLCLPFGLNQVIKQFFSTLGSYPYASANAYNFWAFLGLNWKSQESEFLWIPAKYWGLLVVALILVLVFYLGLKMKNKPWKYYLLSSFSIVSFYIFSVRMHERYVFPAMALLLFSYAFHSSRLLWQSFTGLSVLHFYNTAHVLYFYNPEHYDWNNLFIFMISLATLVFYFYSLWSFADQENRTCFSLKRFASPLKPIGSKKLAKIRKKDLAIILAIVLLYSLFAFYDLGARTAPKSALMIHPNETIDLQFSKDNPPQKMLYYIGPPEARHFSLETSNGLGGNAKKDVQMEKVFTWGEVDLPTDSTEIKLSLREGRAMLYELYFLDVNAQVLQAKNAADYQALFDEEQFFSQHDSFRHNMYFDEIYHARTAFEFTNALVTYETTHPPLGKVMISFGIALFGMNPFAWRFMGCLFGVFMIPFLYLWAKKMSGSTMIAALSAFVFSFDFMHFVQSRIATIDVFACFFVIAMYYFMYQYSQMNFYDVPIKKTFIPLALSGLFVGFAFATKWNTIYAGLGLFVLFFGQIYRRYREYLYAKLNPEESSEGIEHEKIIRMFGQSTVKTLVFCCFAFLLLPLAIYCLSYLPFVSYTSSGFFQKILSNQALMLNYHRTLINHHAYASRWYEWPLMIRPIWYYARSINTSIGEGITTMGHPLIWWMGIPAFFYQLKIIWQSHKTNLMHPIAREEAYNSVFLVTGYLTSYLPWVLVSRETFVYHYLICVPFLVLMIGQSFVQWRKRVTAKQFSLGVGLYAILVFSLFLLFYPVLAGQAIDVEWVKRYLSWLPEWYFVIR